MFLLLYLLYCLLIKTKILCVTNIYFLFVFQLYAIPWFLTMFARKYPDIFYEEVWAQCQVSPPFFFFFIETTFVTFYTETLMAQTPVAVLNLFLSLLGKVP